MAEPFFSVVIPNYNGGQRLRGCLQSLDGQTFRDFETLVVDNGSTDDSVPMVEREFPAVRLIRLPEPAGFARPVNEGIRQSAGRWIFTLNNDAEAERACLEQVRRAIDDHPGYAFFACRLVFRYQPGVINSAGHALSRRLLVVDRGVFEPAARYDEEADVLGACAAAAAYRRDLLNELGGFDEDLSMYYEDADLGVRAQLAGYRCRYLPQATVHHVHAATLGATSPRAVHLTSRNRLLLLAKSIPPALLLRHGLRVALGPFPGDCELAASGRTRLALRPLAAALRLMPRFLLKRIALRRRYPASGAALERFLVN
jgi:hypothetical protein